MAQTIGNCEGFDRYSGQRWIYPNNMKVRGYQKQAVEKALFTNSMIVLPTGFGKTFIAAVVMYNFYRWYPQGKVIFVAPTRPLVNQQIAECKKISGIPPKDCIELTGSISKDKRVFLWKSKRVFFATPQVMENDLEDEALPADQVKCLVIDEAHRAQGGYAYVGIVRQLHERNRNGFRVLALSATPGSDIQRVQQIMLNLYIGDVMFRSEHSIDLMAFKNEKISKAFTLKLPPRHQKIVDNLIKMSSPWFKQLHRAGLTYSGDSIERVARYTLINATEKLRNNTYNPVGGPKGNLSFVCATCVSLSHLFELLTLYGIRVFYSAVVRHFADTKSKLKSMVSGKVEFTYIMDDIKRMFGEDSEPELDKTSKVDLTQGHPKLAAVKETLIDHFKRSDKKETRAIVFTKYRESVIDIVQTLRAFDPLLKPAPFVGQQSAGKMSGMKQKDQIQTIVDFKAGKYNVMVATCVAEEGLDIGEVDLIICYDTTSSPISNTQRRGRTGRKRAGDVRTLLTEGYEEKKLKKAGYSRRQVEDQLFKRENFMSHRYRDSPRLVPADIMPLCLEQKIFPLADEEEEEEVKTPKRKRKSKTDKTVVSETCKKKAKKIESEDELANCDIFGEPLDKGEGRHSDNEAAANVTTDNVDTDTEPEILEETEGESKKGSQATSDLHTIVKDTSIKVSQEDADSDLDWGSELEFNCV